MFNIHLITKQPENNKTKVEKKTKNEKTSVKNTTTKGQDNHSKTMKQKIKKELKPTDSKELIKSILKKIEQTEIKEVNKEDFDLFYKRFKISLLNNSNIFILSNEIQKKFNLIFNSTSISSSFNIDSNYIVLSNSAEIRDIVQNSQDFFQTLLRNKIQIIKEIERTFDKFSQIYMNYCHLSYKKKIQKITIDIKSQIIEFYKKMAEYGKIDEVELDLQQSELNYMKMELSKTKLDIAHIKKEAANHGFDIKKAHLFHLSNFFAPKRKAMNEVLQSIIPSLDLNQRGILFVSLEDIYNIIENKITFQTPIDFDFAANFNDSHIKNTNFNGSIKLSITNILHTLMNFNDGIRSLCHQLTSMGKKAYNAKINNLKVNRKYLEEMDLLIKNYKRNLEIEILKFANTGDLIQLYRHIDQHITRILMSKFEAYLNILKIKIDMYRNSIILYVYLDIIK